MPSGGRAQVCQKVKERSFTTYNEVRRPLPPRSPPPAPPPPSCGPPAGSQLSLAPPWDRRGAAFHQERGRADSPPRGAAASRVAPRRRASGGAPRARAHTTPAGARARLARARGRIAAPSAGTLGARRPDSSPPLPRFACGLPPPAPATRTHARTPSRRWRTSWWGSSAGRSCCAATRRTSGPRPSRRGGMRVGGGVKHGPPRVSSRRLRGAKRDSGRRRPALTIPTLPALALNVP